MARIEIQNLSKRFGSVEVLIDIAATFTEGAFTVILGPSGCGKSTLLRAIAGLETVDTGDILKDGGSISALPPKERGCAMVFQNYALYPHMSVADNIGYGLRLAGMARDARTQRIGEVATLLGLQDLLTRKPHELSGGQRQRVAMGRAIAREPDIFLFDEPLSNLDAKLRTSMRLELRRLHDRLGATTIYVTHDQAEAMTLADQVIIMKGGRIQQVGAPDEIYAHPANTFVAGFLGSPPVNLLNARIGESGHVLDFGGGVRIDLEPTPCSAHPGRAVIAGWRPEALTVCGDSDDRGTLPADIGLIEDLGAYRLVHARVGGQPVIAMTNEPRASLAPGRARLRAPVDALMLFDAETGDRLPD